MALTYEIWRGPFRGLTRVKIHDPETKFYVIGTWSDLQLQQAYHPEIIVEQTINSMRERWVAAGGKDFNIKFEHNDVLAMELSYKE